MTDPNTARGRLHGLIQAHGGRTRGCTRGPRRHPRPGAPEVPDPARGPATLPAGTCLLPHSHLLLQLPAFGGPPPPFSRLPRDTSSIFLSFASPTTQCTKQTRPVAGPTDSSRFPARQLRERPNAVHAHGEGAGRPRLPQWELWGSPGEGVPAEPEPECCPEQESSARLLLRALPEAPGPTLGEPNAASCRDVAPLRAQWDGAGGTVKCALGVEVAACPHPVTSPSRALRVVPLQLISSQGKETRAAEFCSA